jgi:hypothetical protein
MPLAALGITGNKFAAYDVWAGAPLPDITTTVPGKLGARESRTIAIRPILARPQVIGTSRHVVQGAVDVVDESWAAATRTLSATAKNLDGRPYAITIAVPRGMRPGACKADLPCTVNRLASGHVVLQWAAGDGRDIRWEITFRSPQRRRD